MPMLLATSRSSTKFHAMVLVAELASCREGCGKKSNAAAHRLLRRPMLELCLSIVELEKCTRYCELTMFNASCLK
jgi:hypothetical protein